MYTYIHYNLYIRIHTLYIYIYMYTYIHYMYTYIHTFIIYWLASWAAGQLNYHYHNGIIIIISSCNYYY